MAKGALMTTRARRSRWADRASAFLVMLVVNAIAFSSQGLSATTKPVDYLIEPIDGTYRVRTAANIRAAPSNDGAVIAVFEGGKHVKVSGKVAQKNWYLLALDDTSAAYVHGSLIAPLESYVISDPPRSPTDDGFGRAIEVLKQRVEQDPDNPLNHFFLAEGYRKFGRLAEAEEHYRQTVSLAPMSVAGKKAKELLGEITDRLSSRGESDHRDRTVGRGYSLERITGMYRVTEAVNVRALPSAEASRIGGLEAGTTIEVIAKVAGRHWYLLAADSIGWGYAHGAQLSPVTAESTEALSEGGQKNEVKHAYAPTSSAAPGRNMNNRPPRQAGGNNNPNDSHSNQGDIPEISSDIREAYVRMMRPEAKPDTQTALRQELRTDEPNEDMGEVKAFKDAALAYANAGDEENAVKSYRKAAALGDAEAQFLLGIHYSLGQGVSQDNEKALHWFRLAADQGYADAQYELAVLYQYGAIGVEADPAKAADWYREVIKQPDQYLRDLALGNMEKLHQQIQ